MTPSEKTFHQPPHIEEQSIVKKTSWLKRLFSKDDGYSGAPLSRHHVPKSASGIVRRFSRKVVPVLSRPTIFTDRSSKSTRKSKRRASNSAEGRTRSADRWRDLAVRKSHSMNPYQPTVIESSRHSSPYIRQIDEPVVSDLEDKDHHTVKESWQSVPGVDETERIPTQMETQSISTTIFDEIIFKELEQTWILNQSMHFRENSSCEKFFVTYAETPTHWRRVTISLDYSETSEGSLEEELQRLHFQKDKIARIYEAIRESLSDIQFYDTVTNLRLLTKNERLHVHVIEDFPEIISYPSVAAISHLNCRIFDEDELAFDSHISGFVYKVRIHGQHFIKKEIPGPDSVDEFLYEVNALHRLLSSSHVIQFEGVVVDSKREHVKGLLISYAEKGALIDIIYDGDGKIPWTLRERWAHQILQGLADIHDAGFVQGDFTISNIVIDADDNAKIIDINRRGCPIGWEPPEISALVAGNQPVSMYVGVKSDLYQLGMVLYALGLQDDEPEKHRPLDLDLFPADVPPYFTKICLSCLNDQPRLRSQASYLLSLFPDNQFFHAVSLTPTPETGDTYYEGKISLDDYQKNILKPPHSQSRDTGWLNSYDSEVTDTSEDQDYLLQRGISSPTFSWRSRMQYEIPSRPEFLKNKCPQKSALKDNFLQEPQYPLTVSRSTTATIECSDLSGMDTVFEVSTEVENEFTKHMQNDDEFVKIS